MSHRRPLQLTPEGKFERMGAIAFALLPVLQKFLGIKHAQHHHYVSEMDPETLDLARELVIGEVGAVLKRSVRGPLRNLLDLIEETNPQRVRCMRTQLAELAGIPVADLLEFCSFISE